MEEISINFDFDFRIKIQYFPAVQYVLKVTKKSKKTVYIG